MRAPPLKLRRKPRQDRSEHTVAMLIEAAAQVLEADGLEGFNTNAVARRAGVSIGSLYQYFPGKDALTVALMRRENARFHDDSVAAFACVDGHDALTRYIAAAVHQQLARPRLARLLDIEEGRPEIQDAFRDTTTLRRHLEVVLQRPDLPTQPRPRVAGEGRGGDHPRSHRRGRRTGRDESRRSASTDHVRGVRLSRADANHGSLRGKRAGASRIAMAPPNQLILKQNFWISMAGKAS